MFIRRLADKRMIKGGLGLLALLAVLAHVMFGSLGCDGEGFPFLWKASVDSGDQTGNNTPVGGTTPTTPDEPVTPINPEPTDAVDKYKGTWLASWSDDLPGGVTNQSYAARLVIEQSGSTFRGTGRMVQVLRANPAMKEGPITLTGSTDSTGLDGLMTFSSASMGVLTWRLRAVRAGLIGYYQAEVAGGGMRAGCVLWRKASETAKTGAYVTAFGDLSGESQSNYPATSRTGVMTLSRTNSTLNGLGGFDEQILGSPHSLPVEFMIERGAVQDSTGFAGFTFGSGGLDREPYDWYGYMDGQQIAAAYSQFAVTSGSAVETQVRTGNTLWRVAGAPKPEDVAKTWVTAFSDLPANGGIPETDYLAVVTLTAQTDGPVTGQSAYLLSEADSSPAFANYNIANGNFLGTRLVFDMLGRERFNWDMRLAGSMLLGSYQRSGGTGRRAGVAEWRPLTTPSLAGKTWAAAYTDTEGMEASPGAQLAVLTINASDTMGSFSGTGGLRIAGQTRRRVFTISGSVFNGEITWTWKSPDGFGDTTWRLRQAGTVLYGTYTNYTANGAIEFRGHAAFHQSDKTDYYRPE